MKLDDMLANFPGGDIGLGQFSLKEVIRRYLSANEKRKLYEWLGTLKEVRNNKTDENPVSHDPTNDAGS